MELVNDIRSVDGLVLGFCCRVFGKMVDFPLGYIFGIGISGGENSSECQRWRRCKTRKGERSLAGVGKWRHFYAFGDVGFFE